MTAKEAKSISDKHNKEDELSPEEKMVLNEEILESARKGEYSHTFLKRKLRDKEKEYLHNQGYKVINIPAPFGLKAYTSVNWD